MPLPPSASRSRSFTSQSSLRAADTTRSKASSLSNAADDERSMSSDENETVRGSESRRVGPRYPGEDTRRTSEKELRGFYAYGWASEVYVVCAISSFIPITLEQLARERGVLQSDHKTPCTDLDAPLPPTTQGQPPTESPQCIIRILGTDINTASFAMYTFSISVALQALVIITMSGAADHGRFRKTLLLGFAFAGAITTMLFLPITPDTIVLGAIFAILSNTCYGASSVLLNSFLPLLVRNHPTLQPLLTPSTDDVSENPIAETSAPLVQPRRKSNPEPPPDLQSTSAELTLSTKISSFGIGIGYISALLVQGLAIFLVSMTHSTLLSLRLALLLIGAWWFVFTIPSALWLRARPGPPLHIAHTAGYMRTGLAYAAYSWRSLGRTALHARRLRDVLLFLAAWFLLSDAIATISGTAVMFAKVSLSMQPAYVALINVVATTSGIVGAFTWRKIAGLMGLKENQTVLACILLMEVVPLYGLLGYVPFVKQWGVGGLQQQWELYPLASIHGFIMGGLSSFCRSLFGELVPPGFEAAFFALYSITDKGSSVFGPAIVGLITDATGEIRPAFLFLAVLIATPFPIMCMVDVERGRRDGVALAQELEERSDLDLDQPLLAPITDDEEGGG